MTWLFQTRNTPEVADAEAEVLEIQEQFQSGL